MQTTGQTENGLNMLNVHEFKILDSYIHFMDIYRIIIVTIEAFKLEQNFNS